MMCYVILSYYANEMIVCTYTNDKGLKNIFNNNKFSMLSIRYDVEFVKIEI